MTLPRLPLFSALLALGACAAGRNAAPAPVVAAAPTRGEIIRASLPHNVRVIAVDKGEPVRTASGVAIGARPSSEGPITYVLTNAHVVEAKEGESLAFVVLVDAPTGETQQRAAKVVAAGSVPEVDLAVLEVPGIRLPPVAMAEDRELEMGSDVFVVAAPYGRALSVSAGLVSQVDFTSGPDRVPAMVKTDAAIGYGASGGGIFSASSGRLLGIVEGYRTAKVSIPVADATYSFDVPMPGETFAAPIAKIRAFLKSKDLDRILGDQPASGGAVATLAR